MGNDAVPTNPNANPQASHWPEPGPSTIFWRRRQLWTLLLQHVAPTKPSKQRRLVRRSNHSSGPLSPRTENIRFSITPVRQQVLKPNERLSERAPGPAEKHSTTNNTRWTRHDVGCTCRHTSANGIK